MGTIKMWGREGGGNGGSRGTPDPYPQQSARGRRAHLHKWKSLTQGYELLAFLKANISTLAEAMKASACFNLGYSKNLVLVILSCTREFSRHNNYPRFSESFDLIIFECKKVTAG